MEDPMAIDKKLIDQLLSDYKKPEDIIGENGLLKELRFWVVGALACGLIVGLEGGSLSIRL